ncbi:MAG: desulfoferrodoxin [Eubacteriales Family XIII. Incertae Sedis bacterium]|nr:MAG: desulfoferrodoxin [Clostridiales Family XIII bacterium]
MSVKIFKCMHCGNIIEMVEDKGVPVVCCGEKMTELVPGTSDGAAEKHVPVVTVSGNKVTVNVGSDAHPMTDEHLISWIILETEDGCQRKHLSSADAPEASFMLADGEKAIAAYEYCNLHGLWKADIK